MGMEKEKLSKNKTPRKFVLLDKLDIAKNMAFLINSFFERP